MDEKTPVMTESDKGGSEADVDKTKIPEVEATTSNKNTRNFVIGCVIGAVLNCPLAFAFFLGVEEDPRQLLSNEWLKLLIPGFVVLVLLLILAFTGQRASWRLAAGFAVVFVGVLLYTVNWALSSHPIPTRAEMCTAIREFSAVVEEGMSIQANTPADQARAWRNKMFEVWKANRGKIQYIKYPLPDYRGLLPEEFKALESRQTVGALVGEIQSEVRKIQSNLQPYIIEACTGQ